MKKSTPTPRLAENLLAASPVPILKFQLLDAAVALNLVTKARRPATVPPFKRYSFPTITERETKERHFSQRRKEESASSTSTRKPTTSDFVCSVIVNSLSKICNLKVFRMKRKERRGGFDVSLVITEVGSEPLSNVDPR